MKDYYGIILDVEVLLYDFLSLGKGLFIYFPPVAVFLLHDPGKVDRRGIVVAGQKFDGSFCASETSHGIDTRGENKDHLSG